MNKYILANQILSESSRHSTLFHASPVQNLKELKANNKTMNQLAGRGIYATDDMTYASAFCFEWSDADGIRLGRINNGPWTIELPSKYKATLKKKPCSIYTISSKYFNDMTTQLKTPEWVSSTYNIPVMREYKYKSVLEAFEKNKLKVKWL